MGKAVGFDGFKIELRRRIEEAITSTAQQVAAIAQDEAPVRKIFKGSRRSLRQLSGAELKAEQLSRRHLFGKPGTGPLFIERERQRFFGGQPRVLPTNPNLRAFGRRSPINALSPRITSSDMTRNPREVMTIGGKTFLQHGEAYLSGRGTYEVRNAVARGSLTTHAGQQIVGGGLRKSIHVGDLYSRGSHIKQAVVADIYYAKYVEFGTRHAAGQPFLRPALARVREDYRSRILKSIQQSTRRVGNRPPGDVAGEPPIGTGRLIRALRGISEAEAIE